MRPLSERLEGLAISVECDTYSHDEVALIREAAALAKRYEDAPVIQVESPCLRDCLGDAGYKDYEYPGHRVRMIGEPARRGG